MAKIMLTTGLIVAYGYAMEAFFAWYGGDKYEMYHDEEPHVERPLRLVVLDFAADKRGDPAVDVGEEAFRYNLKILFLVCQSVSVGMWFERFVIIPISLHRDYPALIVELLHAAPLRLRHVHRNHRAVYFPDVPVYPVPADDLDL